MESTNTSIKFEEEDLQDLVETTYDIEKNPLTFLRKNGKEGFKVIKGFFATVILFGFVNFFLAIYSIYKYFANDLPTNSGYYLLLAIIVSIAFVGISYFKSYRNAISGAINIAYEKFNFLLKKVSDLLIEKIHDVFHTKKEDIKSQDIKTLINLQEIYAKVFSKLPKFIVKGITILLNRIPVLDIVLDFKNDIESGKKTEASDKLFTKIDTQIRDNILTDASKSWVYWMLPLNIVIILTIVYLKLN